MRYYVRERPTNFRLYENGTVLLIKAEEDSQENAHRFLHELAFIPDFRVVEMRDGHFTVTSHEVGMVLLLSPEISAQLAELTKHQAQAKFSGEVFLHGDKNLPIGLVGRAKLWRDAADKNEVYHHVAALGCFGPQADSGAHPSVHSYFQNENFSRRSCNRHVIGPSLRVVRTRSGRQPAAAHMARPPGDAYRMRGGPSGGSWSTSSFRKQEGSSHRLVLLSARQREFLRHGRLGNGDCFVAVSACPALVSLLGDWRRSTSWRRRQQDSLWMQSGKGLTGLQSAKSRQSKNVRAASRRLFMSL